MKKFNKVMAVLLSAVSAALISGTAMAAEVPNEALSGVQPVSAEEYKTAGWEQQLAELKEVNPNATFEDVADMCVKLDNPEAGGLVLVDTAEEKEDGISVVRSVYTDAAVPYFDARGEQTFYSTVWIYQDGNSNKELLWKTYLSIKVTWDNTVPEAIVDKNSFYYWEQKHTDSEYPQLAGESWDCESNKIHNFYKCGWAHYTISLKYGTNKFKSYANEIYVDSRGIILEGGMDQIM